MQICAIWCILWTTYAFMGSGIEVGMGMESHRLLECDFHGSPMEMGIAIWLIREMGIKQRKRLINFYTLNYR